MALRGENVGTAYVRILADGTGLADDIRDDLEDTDKVFDDAGKRHAETYDDEFRKQMKRDRPGNQEALTAMFEGHTQRIRQITEEMTTTYFKNIERNVRRQAGNNERLGDRLAQQLRKGFVEGGGYAQWGRDLRGLFDQMPGWYSTALRELNAIDRRAANATPGKAVSEGIREIGDESDSAMPRLRRFNLRLQDFAGSVSTSFGRGSRNDFVHFFGNMIGFFTALPAKIGNVVERLATFGQAFTQLRAAGGGVLASLRGAATGMASLGTSAAAAGIAIPIVIIVVGTLVSALSLLLGIVVALASALANALVGALAAVAGALLPVIAAFGVVAIAIAGMSDAQKKMVKESFKPLIAGFKEIGKAAAESIFGGTGSKQARETADQFEQTIKRMTNALTSSNMMTLVKNIGGAIADVGSGWAKSMDSPGFRKFIDTMSETLPRQITTIGHIFDRVGAAIGNTFIAMQPLVQNFLDWLDKITTSWAKWTGTTEGQNAMLGFFDRAQDSLKSVGHFLKEVGGLMKDLLFNATGQETGNTLFDDMADGIANFRDYIADGGLEKWFKDAKEFADDLGSAIKGIGQVLDTLDSPGFRSFAGFVIKALAEIMETTSNLFAPVASLGEAFESLFSGDYSGFGKGLLKTLGDIGKGMLDVLTFGFADEILGLFDGINWSEVGSDIVNGLTEGISSAWGGFIGWLDGLWQNMVDSVKSFFGIHSPSTLFASFGVDMILGLIVGLGQAALGLATYLTGLGAQFLGWLWDGLGDLAAFGGRFIGEIANSLTAAIPSLGTVAGALLGPLKQPLANGFSWVKGKASDLGSFLKNDLGNAFTSAGSKAVNLGSRLAGDLSSKISSAKSRAGELASAARDRLGSAFDTARSKAGDLANKIPGLSSAMRGAVSVASSMKTAFGGVRDGIGWVIDKVQSLISWLGRIKVPSLNPGSGVPFVPGIKTGGVVDMLGLHRVKKMASGGLANFAQNYQIGEAGREAIVPLDRPLGQVDPAVRLLSAFAQGKLGSMGSNDNSRSIDASGWIIQSPNDSATVAQEMLDALVAKIN